MQPSNDSSTVVWTGLPFFPINPMLVFVLSLGSIGSKKIADARPSCKNRLFKNLPRDLVETFDLCHRQAVDLSIWVVSGPEKNLIRVNVPDPRNDLLVHEERLQPTPPLSEDSYKVLL